MYSGYSKKSKLSKLSKLFRCSKLLPSCLQHDVMHCVDDVRCKKGELRPTCPCGWVRRSGTAVTYAALAAVVHFVAPGTGR